MDKMVFITSEELEKRLEEIESIQKQVSNIVYSKNWIKRMFFFRKAVDLHKLAQKKMETLQSG